MRTLTTPDSISGAFASGDNAVKNTIPNSSTGTYLASMEDGFPVITMQPTALGGTPPDGKDFNGILNKVTQFYFQFQNGYLPTFVQATSDLIGGYPEGAVLWYTPAGENKAIPLISLIENNTYNFNTTPAYIDGTHWEYAITGEYVTLHTAQTVDGAKTFTGATKAPTIASVTDNSTNVATTAFVRSVLEAIYSVGSTYIGTQVNCPMAAFFGTWTLVGTGIVTNVNTGVSVAGNGNVLGFTSGANIAYMHSQTESLGSQAGWLRSYVNGGLSTVGDMKVTTNAANSGLQGSLSRTQITVNIWRRTA